MNCRHCGARLTQSFVDLGTAPPSNAYLTEVDMRKSELWYPLRVLICAECWLVQTEDFAAATEIFTDSYAYFSSYSQSWLEHARKYVEMVAGRFNLDNRSLVVELAANDGYLLQYMASKSIPCLGVEPTASTAASAREKGIDIIERFFGTELAEHMVRNSQRADLVIANNVLAHVPDINDFVTGVSLLLKDSGVATFEFPHLFNLVANNQFDTIYHEHYSYLSFYSVHGIFATNGLSVFDVEELPTHGGSLRVYAQRKHGPHRCSRAIDQLIQREVSAGLTTHAYYADFQRRTNQIKDDFVTFLVNAKRNGKKVAAYGAAAKGTTLINYAGLRADLLPYVVDKSPAKQGKFLPGSRIPIVTEDRLQRERPDYVLVLPWNLWDEVTEALSYIRAWGGRFARAIPHLHLE